MNPFSILLIGLAMSTDAFAAAVGKGAAMRHPRWRDALRAGLIFGVIEAITPLIGWLLGSAAARYITAWDHWIAFGVLGLLGAHMIWNGLKPEAQADPGDSTRHHGFWSLAATGLGTSIDAMAVGVSLAFLDPQVRRTLWGALAAPSRPRVVTLEVFSEEDLEDSLRVLEEDWEGRGTFGVPVE